MITFNSQVSLGAPLPTFPTEQVKNEPMLFGCDFTFGHTNGGPLTRAFLDALGWKSGVLDSRVHMLMKGWWPAIPGYHHDDVPRTRSDGQPDYDNLAYRSEHALALVGDDCCPTDFAIGNATFPDIPLGEKCYKVWHPIVEEKIASGELTKLVAPMHQIVLFDWQTWHQGTCATKPGWRWFIRASRKTDRPVKNEIRRQVQVYLEKPMEGW